MCLSEAGAVTRVTRIASERSDAVVRILPAARAVIAVVSETGSRAE